MEQSQIQLFVMQNIDLVGLNYFWEESTRLTIKKETQNGFDISIEDSDGVIHIETDNGYHTYIEIQDYKSYKEALTYIFGLVRDMLSTTVRIRVILKNNKPVKWILEYFDGSKWQQEDIMGLLFFNIFGKTTQQIYTNDILPPREVEKI